MDEFLRELQRQTRDDRYNHGVTSNLNRYINALERIASQRETRFENDSIALYTASADEFLIQISGNLTRLEGFIGAYSPLVESDPFSITRVGPRQYLISLVPPPHLPGKDIIESLRSFPPPPPSDYSERNLAVERDWKNLLNLLSDVRDDGFSHLYLDLSQLNISVHMMPSPFKAGWAVDLGHLR